MVATTAAHHRCRVDDSWMARLLRSQDGVVSRRQVLEHGGDDVVIERRLRRREWACILTGVYVAHTGRRPGVNALGLRALRATSRPLRNLRPPAHVSAATTRTVDRGGHAPSRRCVRSRASCRRLTDYDRCEHLSPPRLGVEAALLRVAAQARTEDRAVSVLADGCQCGATTPARLACELELTAKPPKRPCSRRSSSMSERAPSRLSSGATCDTSNVRTDCRVPHDNCPIWWTAHVSSATSSTQPRPPMSSWTGAWATRPPTTDGMTWIAIWAVRPWGSRRCESAGNRCSSRAGRRSRSAVSSPPEAGPGRPTLRTALQRRVKDWTFSGTRRRKVSTRTAVPVLLAGAAIVTVNGCAWTRSRPRATCGG